MTSGPSLLLLALAAVMAETALLLALVKLVDRYAPSHWVRERHDLALAAVLLVPVLMLITLTPAQLGSPTLTNTLSASTALSEDTPTVPGNAGFVQDVPRRTADATADVGAQARHTPWALSNGTLMLIWLAGSLAMMLRLGTDAAALTRLRHRSRPLGRTGQLGLTKDLEIRSSDDIASPMLAGFRHPCILVPTGFSLSEDAAPVLEHEIAHAQRADNWITLGHRLVSAAFWWNIPLHYLTPMIVRSRESLCDRDAAVATGAPTRLAHALLDAAAAASRLPAPPSARLAAQAHGVALEERVKHLTQPDAAKARRPRATLRLMLPVLASAAYLLVPGLGTAAPEEEANDGDRRIEASLERLNKLVFGNGVSLVLYEAAEAGNTAEVAALLERGVDPSAPALGDGTPLMGAIRGGHLNIVRTLLAAGADPNVASPGDGTALISAARKGDRTALKLLLDAGASPDVTVPGDGAALISAAARDDLVIIAELLAAGADPNVAIGGDGTPLIAAALRGNTAAAQALLAAGADANGYVLGDETPLINAAQQGHLEVGKLLVAQGADVSLTVRTSRGTWRSPLSQAEERGHPAFVAWLESLGAAHAPGRE